MEPEEFTENKTSCIVSGNNIESSSRKDRVSSVVTNYQYRKSYIKTAPSATLSMNTCKGGLISTNTGAIEISGAVNFITQNKIYREDGNIRCYVGFVEDTFTASVLNLSRGIVTHNYFDKPYVNNSHGITNYTDAVIIDQVGDNPYQWIIEKNINQMFAQNIPFTSSQYYMKNGGLGGFVNAGNASSELSDTFWFLTNAPSINHGYRSETLWYHDDVANAEDPPPGRSFGWQENIDKYVPKGAKIVSLTIGIRVIYGDPESHNTMRNAEIKIFINKYKKSYIQGPAINIIDIPTLSTPLYPIPVGAGENDTGILNDTDVDQTCIFYSAPDFSGTLGTALFKILDLTNFNGVDVSEDYVVGLQNSFSISMVCYLQRNIGVAASVDILFTPVGVTYRW